MIQLQRSQAGFTIFELTIATVIFSIILIAVTSGILSFSHDYYKGINSSATQTATAAAVDAISQAVKYGGAAPTWITSPGQNYLCAGGNIFYFDLGVNYQDASLSQSNYGIYEQPTGAGGGCSGGTPTISSNGKELLGNNMRVTYVSFSQVGSSKTSLLHLRVAYSSGGLATAPGNDLLCAPISQLGSCAPGAATLTNTQLKGSDVTCKGVSGTQFCALSDLSTAITQRL